MSKVCTKRKVFFTLALLLANLFVPVFSFAAGTSYTWQSSTTIKRSGSDPVLNFSMSTNPNDNRFGNFYDQNGKKVAYADYYFFVSKETITCYGSTVPYLLVVDKTDPSKGLFENMSCSSTDPTANSAENVTINDPKGVAPKPLVKFTSGHLWGRVVQSGEWKNSFDQYVLGIGEGGMGAIGSATDKREVCLQDDQGSNLPDFNCRGIGEVKDHPEENGTFAFSLDANHSLLPGKYRLKFNRVFSTADCSGIMNSSGGLCTWTFDGTLVFNLKENGDIILDTTDPVEKKSGLNINNINSYDEGVVLGITESVSSPLDAALLKGLEWMAGFVNFALDKLVNMIEALLLDTKSFVTNGNIQDAWIKMRNIGLSLLVMALVIIAFANVLQVDIEAYGLNRMIPKIIIAIIMSYFSWLIFLFFFDFTEALQKEAANLISANPLSAIGGMTIPTPSAGDVLNYFGAWLFIIVIFFGVIACAFVLWFSLILRIVMLSFLLAVAPLAAIFSIMPFTATMYKRWWAEFWKWMFMGPVALIIIALGSVIASSNGGLSGGIDPSAISSNLIPGTGGSIAVIINLVIFAAALYMAAAIPLQWGGKIMAQWRGVGKKAWGLTGGKAWGATGGRVALRAKTFMAERKSEREQRDKTAASKFRTRLMDGQVGGMKINKKFGRWAAGGPLESKVGEAMAERAHSNLISSLIKEHGYDQMDQSRLQKELNNAKPGSEEELAIFEHMMEKGWTNNAQDENGVYVEQERFDRLASHHTSLIAKARVAGKGRDFLLNSDNPTLVQQALSDASKEEIKNWGGDESRIMLDNALKGQSRGLTGDALKARISQLEEEMENGNHIDTEEYRQLKAFNIVNSIEGGKMKRGFEQSGSAKSGLFVEAAKKNPELFNAGTLKTIVEEMDKKGVRIQTLDEVRDASVEPYLDNISTETGRSYREETLERVDEEFNKRKMEEQQMKEFVKNNPKQEILPSQEIEANRYINEEQRKMTEERESTMDSARGNNKK